MIFFKTMTDSNNMSEKENPLRKTPLMDVRTGCESKLVATEPGGYGRMARRRCRPGGQGVPSGTIQKL